MPITEIDYCSWDGDPALIVSYSDGRMHGFHFDDGKWKQVKAVDVATEAPIMTEAAFKSRWPDIGRPEAIRAETASSKQAEELVQP